MLEVMIEQWKNLDGSVDYPWSVWRDGVRVHMGGVLGSAEDAETDAKAAAARTAMLFSRINTMLSVPMLYAMVSAQHIY